MIEGKTLRELAPLKRRKILKKSLGNAISVFFAGGFTTLVGYALLKYAIVQIPEDRQGFANLLIFLWFAFLAVLMFWRMIYQYLYYLAYLYDMDDKNVTVTKGVITKRTIILPFKRITDVYVDQDLWDVFLGLYDVHISTPTEESGEFAHIDGVDKNGADLIRQLVLDRIHVDTD